MLSSSFQLLLSLRAPGPSRRREKTNQTYRIFSINSVFPKVEIFHIPLLIIILTLVKISFLLFKNFVLVFEIVSHHVAGFELLASNEPPS